MRKLLGAAAAAAMLFSFTAASAAQVTVINGDFSQGWAQTDGAYVPMHERPLPGWGASGGSGTGHWNPTLASFVDEADHGGVGWTSGGITLNPTPAFIGQVIQDLVIQANTRYTLTLDVGRYFGQMATQYDFGFIAGWGTTDAFIAARLLKPLDQGGEFQQASLVFETGATGPAIGKSLMIALGSTGGVAYDNVTLDATPLSTAVPEPATWAMMITGFGLAGGLMRRRHARALAA